MLDFITSHPLYIPFVIINALVLYKIIRDVRSNDKGRYDDEDGGVYINDEPVLDLPPGVTLPVSPKEPVLSE
jgi:hypothetical protein